MTTTDMQGKNAHPSDDLLRSFVDDATPAGQLVPHLKDCASCRARVKAFRAFDASLKSALTERAPVNTADLVLRRLGVRERQSFALKSVQLLAPALALGIVCTVMYVAFRVTGAFNTPEAQDSATALGTAVEASSRFVSGFGNTLTSWLSGYISFAFAQSTFGQTAFFVLFLAGVALLDKFVFVPWFRNRRMG